MNNIIVFNSLLFHSFVDINYFHCCRIIELLKVSEADTKNMFGYYSSQRMKVSVQHTHVRDEFKTQLPVDRRFCPVPGGCHCLEQ